MMPVGMLIFGPLIGNGLLMLVLTALISRNK
jgi:hypothetical protein